MLTTCMTSSWKTRGAFLSLGTGKTSRSSWTLKKRCRTWRKRLFLSSQGRRASNLFRLDPAMNYQVIISLFHPFPRVQRRNGPDNISSSRWRSPVGSSAQEKKSIVGCWSTSRPSATPKLLKAHTLVLKEKRRQRQTEHRPESLRMLAKI